MVNKSFLRMCIRSIKGSLSRFIAIVSIVALGTGFLAGLLATTPDMQENANNYFKEKNVYDFYIQSTLGFSDDDIEAINDLSYVKQTMAINQEDQMISDQEGETYATRIYHIDFEDKTALNQFAMIEGRNPKNDDECVAVIPNPYSTKINIGDELINDDGKKYEVVGIARSPLFLSLTQETTTVGAGGIGLALFVRNSDDDVTAIVYATCNIDAGDMFSDEYKDSIKALKKKIEAFGEEQVKLRHDELVSEAQSKLDEQKESFEATKKATNDKLANTKAELAANQTKVENAISQIDVGIKKIDDSLSQMPDIPALASQREALQNQKKQLTTKRAELEAQMEKIEQGFASYNTAKVQAEAGFKEAEAKIADGQKQVDEISEGAWYITSRLDSVGLSGYKGDTEKVAAIAKVIPIFFFLVAALVVLTTMTRMIEEERGQVGALKSLGYSNRSIRSYYFAYGTVATLIGSAIGFAVGFTLFPKVISNAYAMMYNLPEADTPFLLWLAAPIFLVMEAIVILTIYFSCRSELSEKPAALLLPKAPEPGKRILLERLTPIWSRLKFTRKVTFRNLFRYKKRFLMTIIGMAGCFALLITGFGVRDSIKDIADLQYGEIFKYDVVAYADKDDWQPKEDFYEEQGFFMADTLQIEVDGAKKTVDIQAPEDAGSIGDFIQLRTRKNHDKITLEDGGIVLPEKFCEKQGLKRGDKLSVIADGNKTEVELIGIAESYASADGYMNKVTYEKLYKKEISPNVIYLNIDKTTKENVSTNKISQRIMEEDGVKYVLSSASVKDTFSDSVKSIDYIVMVIILSAGGLSIIVLYNLTNVNICERKKELATIKVLGFYPREVTAYIFREINLLAAIGVLFGVPLGILLHNFVIKTAEVDEVMFGRSIAPMSYLFAFLTIAIFTFIVNLIMRKSIKKIDMVESMKAND